MDVSRVLFDGGHPYAVQFEPDYPATRYVKPTHPLARQHAELAHLFPEQRVTITSWTADYRRALAVVEGDRMPGDLVLVNAESGNVERLMSRRPALEPSALAPMTPVAFAARDGATVHGYVTGDPARRPGAMVVLVHDGPHGVRDVWGFDAIGQLLASRGYQVLQVNFRGSGGYGSAYARRGFGAWGGLMQDDVTDADPLGRRGAESLIPTAFASWDRATAPTLRSWAWSARRARTAVRSPSAASTIWRRPPRVASTTYRLPGLRQTRERVGSAGLDSLSPARRAAAVDVPVLLAHGMEDGRSPPRQARRMRKALARAGNPADWVPLAGEGHEVRDPGKRADLYERVLGFLHSHAAPD